MGRRRPRGGGPPHRGRVLTRAERVRQLRRRLGEDNSEVYRAPGRVNLIGEHVDYLGGLVLPFACDLETLVAAVPSAGPTRIVSLDVDDESWHVHVDAVAAALGEAGHAVRAVKGVLSSTVPVGAGLSSSAALEAALALALTGGIAPAPDVLQRAEQRATGVPAGVMDQTSVLVGRAGHALLLDCRTRVFEHVPLGETLAFLVLDTGTRRALADGRYAARRAEVDAAAAHAVTLSGAGHVTELRPADLWPLRGRLGALALRRLRHAVTEIERVRRTVDALRSGDPVAVGELVDASHRSLRDDFEVSSDALDAACAIAAEHPACLGARLVGAGFAGCALAVVRGDATDDAAAWIGRRLAERLPAARVVPVAAADGAGAVT